MNIPQEQKATEIIRQEQPAAATPQRRVDWISYAVAVTQQATSTSTNSKL